MLKVKIVSAVAAAALACALCPALAVAEPIAAGSVSAQASTVKVALVAKTTLDGETTKYAYGKNGMLAKFSNAKTGTSGKYTYSGGKLAKYVEASGPAKRTVTYSYDKKGRVSKQVEEYASGTYRSKTTTTFSYDAKGRVKGSAAKRDGGLVEKRSYAYDKAGRPTKVTEKWYSGGTLVNSGTVTQKYDSKGNLKSHWRTSERDYSTLYDFANTYSSGRLAKSVISYNRSSPATYTKKLTYKTVRLPKAAAAKAKAQQWVILNSSASPTYQFPPALTV